MKKILLFIAMALACGCFAENLLQNPAFTELDENGHPVGWVVSHPNHLRNHRARVTVEEDVNPTVRYLRIDKLSGPVPMQAGDQEVAVPPGATALRIRAKMRGHGLRQGEENWQMAGIGLTFLFADGTSLPGNMGLWIRLPEGSSDWKEYETVIPVRNQAPRASLSIVPHGWAGMLDVQWVEMQAVMEEPGDNP